jgi:hypothetical protein
MQRPQPLRYVPVLDATKPKSFTTKAPAGAGACDALPAELWDEIFLYTPWSTIVALTTVSTVTGRRARDHIERMVAIHLSKFIPPGRDTDFWNLMSTAAGVIHGPLVLQVMLQSRRASSKVDLHISVPAANGHLLFNFLRNCIGRVKNFSPGTRWNQIAEEWYSFAHKVRRTTVC